MTTEYVHPFERVGLGKAPFKVIGFRVSKYQSCQGAPIQCGSSCDYCGTGIMNVFTIKGADGKTFKVGCDCVAKTGDSALTAAASKLERSERAKLAAVTRQARRDAGIASRAEQNRQRAAAWISEQSEELREALKSDHPTIRDIVAKLQKYGSISKNQINFVLMLHTPAELVGCEPPPAVPVPPLSGRSKLVARILSIRVEDSFRGGLVCKALYAVRTPYGQWKAWGTIPSGAYAAVGSRPVERGDVLEIVASVERSDRDEGFAFIKRPAIVKARAKRNEAA